MKILKLIKACIFLFLYWARWETKQKQFLSQNSFRLDYSFLCFLINISFSAVFLLPTKKANTWMPHCAFIILFFSVDCWMTWLYFKEYKIKGSGWEMASSQYQWVLAEKVFNVLLRHVAAMGTALATVICTIWHSLL